MGKGAKQGPATATVGSSAKQRHTRAQRSKDVWTAPLPRVALPALPEKKINEKHQSYFELVENKDKRKKLEFEVTVNKRPPPGFEFVPIGNPELTTACKELSREQDAMIFIVSSAKDAHTNSLILQTHRTGHHIRRTIVEQARAEIGQDEAYSVTSHTGAPEPIPETQEEISAQADAALKDLFPRIPNTDRQMVIDHAFKKGGHFKGEPMVGMAAEIPLSRRVQLAVLAHIRHTHTRYDELLKETKDWAYCRSLVEQPCLDILVKWRGDEETGRDQLDEILREVVVINDDSDDSDETDDSGDGDDEDDRGVSTDDAYVQEILRISNHDDPFPVLANIEQNTGGERHSRRSRMISKTGWRQSKRLADQATQASTETALPRANRVMRRAGVKKAQRGFKRYEAEAQRHLAWEKAVDRNRAAQNPDTASGGAPADGMPRYGSQQCQPPEAIAPDYREPTATSDHFPDERHPSYHDMGPRQYNAPYPNGFTTANSQRLEFVPPLIHPNHSSTSSREVVVGYRTVAGPPVNHQDTQSEPMAVRDLKDYLVRSIEPVSPQSAAPNGPSDGPRFVRRMPYGEPGRPEQVSSGRYESTVMRPTRTANQAMDRAFYQTHSALNDVSRPVRVPSQNSGRTIPQPDQYHEIQNRLPNEIQAPIRSRRAPETFDDPYSVHRASTLAANGFLRIERDSPQPIARDEYYQEDNPHRIIQIRRAGEELPREPGSVRVSAPRHLPVDRVPGGHMVCSRTYEVRGVPPAGPHASFGPASGYHLGPSGHLERQLSVQAHSSYESNGYRQAYGQRPSRPILIDHHDTGRPDLQRPPVHSGISTRHERLIPYSHTTALPREVIIIR